MEKNVMLYFDVMLDGVFLFQIAYSYCPLFRLDLKDVLAKVYSRRPSLAKKRIELYHTENVVR